MKFKISVYTVDRDAHGVSWPAFPTVQEARDLAHAQEIVRAETQVALVKAYGEQARISEAVLASIASMDERGQTIKMQHGTRIEVEPLTLTRREDG